VSGREHRVPPSGPALEFLREARGHSDGSLPRASSEQPPLGEISKKRDPVRSGAPSPPHFGYIRLAPTNRADRQS